MSKHFKEIEFYSPAIVDGVRKARYVPVPRAYIGNLKRLMEALEVIRTACDDKPVKIISGYRTKAYNARNKGRATKSQHLLAKAADIQVKGMSPRAVFYRISNLISRGLIPKGGLACYPTFVHYDIRGRNARWRREP